MKFTIEDSKFNIEDIVHTTEKTGEAMKHLSELIDKSRAEHPEFYIVDAESGENRGSVVQDDYDPYTGKYAFVSPDDDISDEEYEAAAQEAHDELVRSLTEVGGAIREARELLARSLEMLYLLGYDSSFTNPAIDILTSDIKKFLEDTL